MIIGIGTDIVSIARIRDIMARHEERFIDKCFTAQEKEQAQTRRDPACYYAKRYAAKEAMLKALGTGMRAGLAWHDMAIVNDDLGAPVFNVTGGVAQTLQTKIKQGDKKPIISVSLSDEDAYAVAFVIVETSEE